MEPQQCRHDQQSNEAPCVVVRVVSEDLEDAIKPAAIHTEPVLVLR
jgi:hypothetical protein